MSFVVAVAAAVGVTQAERPAVAVVRAGVDAPTMAQRAGQPLDARGGDQVGGLDKQQAGVDLPDVRDHGGMRFWAAWPHFWR